jgi:predicted peroxiredoxin
MISGWWWSRCARITLNIEDAGDLAHMRTRRAYRYMAGADGRGGTGRSWRDRPASRRSVRLRGMAPRSLVVKVTAGKDDPERCSQAFTVAATAVASGLTVSLWLTGDAAWLALPDRASEIALPYAAPLEDLLASVLAGGTVTLCTQCASRRNITADDTLDGVRIAGASTFLAEIMTDDAQALVY